MQDTGGNAGVARKVEQSDLEGGSPPSDPFQASKSRTVTQDSELDYPPTEVLAVAMERSYSAPLLVHGGVLGQWDMLEVNESMFFVFSEKATSQGFMDHLWSTDHGLGISGLRFPKQLHSREKI